MQHSKLAIRFYVMEPIRKENYKVVQLLYYSSHDYTSAEFNTKTMRIADELGINISDDHSLPYTHMHDSASVCGLHSLSLVLIVYH